MAIKIPPPPTGGGTTTTSSSSGSSSPSSSSSTSSAPKGPSPQEVANAVASFTNLWSSWGIPITPAIKQWVETHVKAGVGSQEMLALFRKTKAYAHRFPGIMKGDGVLRMTESQYLSGFNAAKDYAATLGRTLSLHAYGMAIKNGNSPNELKQKLQALDSLKANGQMFSEFSDYLLSTGVTKKPLTREDTLKFIMRQGPKQWEQEWTAAYVSTQLANVGIDVGKPKTGSDLSYKELGQLTGPYQSLMGQASTAQGAQSYQDLARQVAALPDISLYEAGITKKDLVELHFNGKKAPEIALKVQRALATHAAFFESRANPQLTQSQTGTQLMTGQRPVQATE